MYSLLIVDDEPLITDGIYDLFVDSADPELDVYAAYSGEEALNRMAKTKIDIVVTDISMPGMSGLDVQREIKKLWPSCRIIILTGYDEFDYIQSAMRNDGIDYILKTEGEEAILQAVKKAVEEIEEENRKERLIEQARMHMSMSLPVLQAKYLLDLADGWEYDGEEMEKQLEELEIPLNSRAPVLLMAGQVDCWEENISGTQKLKKVYGVKDTVEAYLHKFANAVSVLFERTKMLWFIQPAPFYGSMQMEETEREKEENLLERCFMSIKGYMGSIQSICKDIHHVSVSFALSGSPVDWSKISIRYESLKLKLSKEAGLSYEMLLIDDGDGESPENGLTSFEKEALVRSQMRKLGLLKTYLENGEKENFLALYRGIMEQVDKNADITSDVCTEVYFSLSVMFLSHLNRCKLTEDIGPKIDLNRLTNQEGFSSWSEVIQYFRSLAEKIMEQKDHDSFTNANHIFRFIRNYVDQHIEDDLSLTRFAELLHFHPFYLSRLFKQVTGTSLSEYILRTKAVKAKDMLSNSSLKVNEIALYLGFKTASYFTSFFKKYTGLTPKEYRNLHSDLPGIEKV